MPEELSNWMVRWWVNGKPVVLDIPGSKLIGGKYVITREMLMSGLKVPTAFGFRLEEVAKVLGAGAGDVVEFQMMYCPEGLERESDEDGEMVLMLSESREGARLSNRVRWSP